MASSRMETLFLLFHLLCVFCFSVTYRTATSTVVMAM